jgi:hypothetical protein
MRAALRQLGDCGLAKRECYGPAPASSLAQVHKHPHNRWSHDNASFDPGSGEAALRRSATANLAVRRQLRSWPTLNRLCADSPTANLAVGRQLRAWLRCTNIRTTAGATTTPASTVTQAALRRFTNRESCGGSQLRPWLTLRCTNIRTTAGATTTLATSLAQVRRLCGDRQARISRASGATMLWFHRVVA